MRPLIVDASERTAEDIIQRALSSVREHLGMEIAYLSEFIEESLIFRAVDAPGLEALIKPGDTRRVDEVYCRHIIEGRLPSLIPDTADFPLTQTIPVTHAAPIGSHVSVPIRRSDGSVYGMFCCLSPTPNPSLNNRDLSIMEMFADLCAEQINGAVSEKVQREAMTDAIRQVLAEQNFDVVYQPIFQLDQPCPTGFEALCRFRPDPYRSPDIWFNEALMVGLGTDLELAVIEAALGAFADLPKDVYLSVNASPSAAASGRLSDVLEGHPLHRIVLEVTEHEAIEDVTALLTELSDLRAQGLSLAIDDAGAGYSGLQQIINLSPDILKLDMSLTSDVDKDAAKRSLTAAMVHFAAEQNSVIVAEGIETQAELDTLRNIGVHRGQGWHLGKPAPLDETCAKFFDCDPDRTT